MNRASYRDSDPMKMPNIKPFRRWVEEIWRENVEEHRLYGELPYSQQEYFQKYKYWLRARYQQLRKQGQL